MRSSSKRSSRARSAVEAIVIGSVAVAALGPIAGAARAADTDTGRGYEQVMPAQKDYGFGKTGFDVAVAAHSGGAVAYDAFGPLPGSAAGTFDNFYLGRRGGDAWSTSPLSPPQEPTAGGTNYPVFQGFSADLSKAIVKTANPPLTPDAAPDVTSLYLIDNTSGTYQLLSTGPATTSYSPFATYGGASNDFRHVVFEAQDPLVAGVPDNASLHVYEHVDGALRNVSVLPDKSIPSIATLGGGAQANARVANAVSDDGRRIVFWADGSLYVRVDGTDTIRVSASQRTPLDPTGTQSPVYQGATGDGGRIFFTSTEALTDDANTGTDGAGDPTASGADLYQYDVASGELTDLSVDTDPADAATGANVQGVVANSEDGQYIYFVALGNLAAGATSGLPNLYVRHGAVTRFIGTLDFGDAGVWGNAIAGPGGVTARATPDGRSLVLQSLAPLTAYNNTNPSTGTAHSEVYHYSADADRLTCVSCRPDGEPPTGSATILPPNLLANMTRYVTDDGSRVFFNTTDDLVRGDTNGKQDVYEYVDGAPHLVSTGTSRFDATFQDASGDGTDVVFATADALVPQDVDQHVDLYDARVGGGYPPPSPPTPPCNDDGCQPLPTPPSAESVAASVTFFGPANPAPTASEVVKRVSASKPKAVTGTSAVLKVKVPAKGSVRVSGNGLVARTATASKASTLSIRVRLSRTSVASLRRHSRLTRKAKVTFKPVAGVSSTVTVTVTFKRPTATKKGRS